MKYLAFVIMSLMIASSAHALDLYSLSDPDGAPPPNSLGTGGYAGIAYRASWAAIEPSEGNYDWSTIDAAQAAAHAMDVKWSVGVAAGHHAPAWVYRSSYGAAGAHSIELDGRRGVVPWDRVYLGKFGAFVRALAARYKDDPLLDHFKLTGMNWSTNETLLPSSAADIQVWEAVGGSPERIENAWGALAIDWGETGRKFAGMHGGNFLPALPTDDTQNLISFAANDWAQQYILQNNNLGRFGEAYIWPGLDEWVGQVEIGLQMYAPVGSSVIQSVAAADQFGAAFVEVYPSDLKYL